VKYGENHAVITPGFTAVVAWGWNPPYVGLLQEGEGDVASHRRTLIQIDRYFIVSAPRHIREFGDMAFVVVSVWPRPHFQCGLISPHVERFREV
jgi:hypothetical protein